MNTECFQCVCCWELPIGRVLQCSNGHIVCSECIERLPSNQCATCRVVMPAVPIRCLLAEQALQSVECTCRGSEWGCTWRGLATVLAAHEANCPIAHGVKEHNLLKRRTSELETQVQSVQREAEA